MGTKCYVEIRNLWSFTCLDRVVNVFSNCIKYALPSIMSNDKAKTILTHFEDTAT